MISVKTSAKNSSNELNRSVTITIRETQSHKQLKRCSQGLKNNQVRTQDSRTGPVVMQINLHTREAYEDNEGVLLIALIRISSIVRPQKQYK